MKNVLRQMISRNRARGQHKQDKQRRALSTSPFWHATKSGVLVFRRVAEMSAMCPFGVPLAELLLLSYSSRDALGILVLGT